MISTLPWVILPGAKLFLVFCYGLIKMVSGVLRATLDTGFGLVCGEVVAVCDTLPLILLSLPLFLLWSLLS